MEAKHPSFAISVLRKRTVPTAGKCCLFLIYGISLLLLVGKRKKKNDWYFPTHFSLTQAYMVSGFLAREGGVRGSAGEASEAAHFEAAARA